MAAFAPPHAARRQEIASRFEDIGRHWLADEARLIRDLLAEADLGATQAERITAQAAEWVHRLRRDRRHSHPLQALLAEYDLSSEEGVVLMCLAEALLRIPDTATAEALIADRLGGARWQNHLGHSPSLFVNASTWALMLGARLLAPAQDADALATLRRLAARSGETVVRLALRQAMRLMGEAFVLGQDIGEGLRRAQRSGDGSLHSFDMLGEAAVNDADAARYLARYHDAIDALGRAGPHRAATDWRGRDGISIKLSALHPRFEYHQAQGLQRELTPRLLQLARAAREAGIGLTVDAEEADRLALTLQIFADVYEALGDGAWDGFGLAVQAYSRRAPSIIDWLQALAGAGGRAIAVRLVKGAYWDTEIKRAQQAGLDSYPVYTRKTATDVAWLALARRLLARAPLLYPQFATHNAHAIASVLAMAEAAGTTGGAGGFEFQRLHGMGEGLYDTVRSGLAAGGDDAWAQLGDGRPLRLRIYAPVGGHAELLPYLVRRLLENGANTSFVHHLLDERIPAGQLVADPLARLRQLASVPNPQIAAPPELYGEARRNARGFNLADDRERGRLEAAVAASARCRDAQTAAAGAIALRQPADCRRLVGHWQPDTAQRLDAAIASARAAQPAWAAAGVAARSACLEQAATALETDAAAMIDLLQAEAGKTLPDAVAELREAVDFLRYYAVEARRRMQQPQALPGPAGEHNELQLHGRGLFAAISPWNFPLAIFCGQIAAALATGNTVVAKPAEQTPLIAARAVALLRRCGIPEAALQLVCGDGTLGDTLVADPRVDGVAFTGSVATALAIQRRLAQRQAPIAPLIAETGGVNLLIADSSALPEQLVRDSIDGAFRSAGQRCSATRVLCLQEDIADAVTEMLVGAMASLRLGDPADIATDVGPVIDADACEALEAQVRQADSEGRLLARTPRPAGCDHGHFVAPALIAVDRLEAVGGEHFGPLLHLLRYPAGGLDALVDALNASGWGLTLAVHSRIEAHWRRIQARARVGNCYVNRNQVGSVVGVQPFGGEGWSGTGFKAGGPHYLLRFCVERTLTVNTAAIGGDARLLSRSGD